MNKIFKGNLSQVSIKLIFAIISLLLALYIFGLVLHEIFLEKEEELDYNVLVFLQENTSKQLQEVMLFFSFFGKPHFLIPAFVLVILFFILKKKKANAIQVFALAVSSTTLLFGMKYVFRRERPSIPIFENLPGYSFPSGHALIGFVFFSMLIYMVWRGKKPKWWKLLVIFALLFFSLLIGLSRIILQVHYTTDVIAGFCIGYAWVLFFLWLTNKWNGRKEVKTFKS